jgi:hypothetical protein
VKHVPVIGSNTLSDGQISSQFGCSKLRHWRRYAIPVMQTCDRVVTRRAAIGKRLSGMRNERPERRTLKERKDSIHSGNRFPGQQSCNRNHTRSKSPCTCSPYCISVISSKTHLKHIVLAYDQEGNRYDQRRDPNDDDQNSGPVFRDSKSRLQRVQDGDEAIAGNRWQC